MQLDEHLKTLSAEDHVQQVIMTCAQGVYEIAALVHTGAALGYAGSQNVFGEQQLKLDVASNDILLKVLGEQPLVDFVASEEMDHEQQLHVSNTEEGGPQSSGEFSVAFDPLDGSSLVDVNFAVGTIIAIYPKGSFIGKKPGEMHASVIAVYGPRTTLFVSIKGKGTHQYLLTDGGFMLQKESLKVADEGKYFAPGNLRACLENPSYKKLVDFWLESQYTLRYSGGMVPDINHILLKGKGVFTYPGYLGQPDGKLRLLFECGTMTFAMVEAGGYGTDGKISLLDKSIEALDQRSPIFVGSVKEVEKAVSFFV